MKIIGHRGAKGLAPENTLASLHKALEHHVDAIEFDVRVTKDQTVVLHHNPDIVDASGNSLLIADSTYDELLHHKPDLATLQTIFAEIPKNTQLVIEVKPHETLQPIVREVQRAVNAGWQPSALAFASFSFTILRHLHHTFPDIAMIVNERWSGVRAHHRAKRVAATRVTMNQRWLWSGFIRSVRHGNIELVAYTVNDPKKAKRWATYGLAGVVTDYPDRFTS